MSQLIKWTLLVLVILTIITWMLYEITVRKTAKVIAAQAEHYANTSDWE